MTRTNFGQSALRLALRKPAFGPAIGAEGAEQNLDRVIDDLGSNRNPKPQTLKPKPF